MESWYQQYKDKGFTVITLMGENNNVQTPTPSELMQWANQYGITHPVVVDPNFNETSQYLFADPSFNGSFYLPNMQLLAPGRVVTISNDWVTLSDIQQVLP